VKWVDEFHLEVSIANSESENLIEFPILVLNLLAIDTWHVSFEALDCRTRQKFIPERCGRSKYWIVDDLVLGVRATKVEVNS
jgi:hypothetical protein